MHPLNTVNDTECSLKNTNDLILTNILLLNKTTLDISANTLILNAKNYELCHIEEQN